MGVRRSNWENATQRSGLAGSSSVVSTRNIAMPTATGPTSVTRANAGVLPAGGTSSRSGIASAAGVAARRHASDRAPDLNAEPCIGCDGSLGAGGACS
jgi:hypothetical protein